ncbi:MAG: hypothetical protein ACE5JM_17865, partial [Armatimonadota bacterium]
GEILVTSRVITRDQLLSALQVQAQSRKPLGAILIDMNVAEPYEVAQAVARQCGLLAVNLNTFNVDPAAVALAPAQLCREHELLPIQIHGDLVIVAMAHPRDDEAYAAIREAVAPRRVRCVVANESQISSKLHSVRSPQAEAAAV